MRFAYIDSQGNQVPIPSIDALALRVELGAIGPETELYDAQSDRWGPARKHEIFNTLSRPAPEEGGFVAPPPPLPDETPASEPGEEEEDLLDAQLPPLGETEPEAPATDAGEADSYDDLDFGLTLTEFVAPTPGGDPRGLDPRPESPREGEGSSPEEEEAEATFDLSELTAMDFAPPALVEDPGAVGEDGPLHEGPSVPLDDPDRPTGGLMDFSSASDFGGELDLRTDLEDFAADAPPAWMEQTGPEPEADDAPMQFGPESVQGDAPPHLPPLRTPVEREAPRRPLAEAHGARARPAPQRRVRRRSPMHTALGTIVLLGVASGGYYGWQRLGVGFGGGGADTAAVALPEVIIPELPQELQPVMQGLAERALARTVARIRAMPRDIGLPEEPREDWLSGAYLANASQFPDIATYWEGMRGFVRRVREEDTRIFREQFAARLDSAGITGEEAGLLQARADSGFLSARADRAETYSRMDDLVNAALDLHHFLIGNEASIQYTPAAGGVSGDPVLEAVPDTRELGDEMWSMVDRITEALDGLGTLDRVTTDRLTAVLCERIRQAGFR